MAAAEDMRSGAAGAANRAPAGQADVRQAVSRFAPAVADGLGFGLFLAWAVGLPHARSELFGPTGGSPILSFAVNFAVLLLIAIFVGRMGRRLASRPVLAVASVFMVLACFLPTASALIPNQPTLAANLLQFVRNVFEALALALLFLLWNERIASLVPRHAWTAYAGSYALSAAAYFLVVLVVSTVGAVAAYALATLYGVASCAVLFTLVPRKDAAADIRPKGEAVAVNDEAAPIEEGGPNQVPWRLTVLMLTFSFTYYLFLHLSGGTSPLGLFGRLLIACVLLGVCLVRFDTFDARVLYRTCPTLIVAALLLFALGGSWALDAGRIFVEIGYTGFTLFMFFILSSISFQYETSPVWLFGIVQAMSVLGHGAGTLVGSTLSSPGAVEFAVPAVYGVSVVFVFLSMALLTERDYSTSWGIKPIGRARSSGSDSGPSLDGNLASIEGFAWRVTGVAHAYGLTRREEEVLSLAAQDKTVSDVCQTLGIAQGTAKRHLQHVYEKLGVHSREDAAQVVRTWGRR